MELGRTISKAVTTQVGKPLTEDPELIHGCLAGDEEAWCTLITKYKRLIYSIPIKNEFQPADAADIFQAVCLDLLESLPKLRDTQKLKAWLITVTVRKCMHWRGLITWMYGATGENELEEWISSDADPPRILLEVEREQLVREAIAKLPRRCAALVRHLFFEEPQLPYSKIAAEIGISSNSVGSTRNRCLEKLRKLLEEAGVNLK